MGLGRWKSYCFFYYWLDCLPLSRQCCWKLVRELSLRLETTFLKVWNSFPSGFNSEVSIKSEIKIPPSVCRGFSCWTFPSGYFPTSDEEAGKSISEEQLLTGVRHSAITRQTDGESCGWGHRQKRPSGTFPRFSIMFGQQQKRQYLPAVTWADNGRLSHHRCHHLHLTTCSIHTQKLTLNDTTLLRNTRKVLFSANFSASLFWEAKQLEAPSAGVEVPSDGGDHVQFLQGPEGPELVMRENYVVSHRKWWKHSSSALIVQVCDHCRLVRWVFLDPPQRVIRSQLGGCEAVCPSRWCLCVPLDVCTTCHKSFCDASHMC